MDTDEKIELEVRRIVSKEIGEHRQFLQTQFKLMTWGIGIIVSVVSIVFIYFLGKSYKDARETIVQEVDNRVIQYRINEKLQDDAAEFVKIAVNKAVNTQETKENIRGLVNEETKEIVSSLSKKIQNDLVEIVKKEIHEIQSVDAKGIIEQTVNQRMIELQKNFSKEPTTIVIAAMMVESNKVVSKTQGMNYSSSTGVISFPNPQKLHFVPLISDINGLNYMTDKHYIREIDGHSQFRVWRTTLDETDRNYEPGSFTAVVVGFQ